MVVVKVVGTGCAKCKKLLSNTKSALQECKGESEVMYITDIMQIMNTGITQTPGLIINNKIVATGKLLKVEEIIALLKKHGNC